MLIDTHIHLYAEEFDTDRPKLISDARQAGVEQFLLPNIDPDTVSPMLRVCNDYPDVCYPMMGLHPCHVKAGYLEQLQVIRHHLDENRKRIVGIGEIGMDLFWDLTYRKEQEVVFREQVAWAIELKLPVSIHSRNATGEIIEILRTMDTARLTGVLHCFSGNINQADEIINMGLYLGIGGVVTFKNSELAAIVSEVPMEMLVVETDGPYLAPTPHRGKRNLPAYLKLVAEKIAEIKKMTLAEVESITTRNARELFLTSMNRSLH